MAVIRNHRYLWVARPKPSSRHDARGICRDVIHD